MATRIGDDTINGEAGIDTVSYASATSGITLDLSNPFSQNTVGAGIDYISNIENAVGSAFNDTISGKENANMIDGSLGNDTLHGGDGVDSLYGGDGLDTLYGDAGADLFVFEAASAYNNVDVIQDFSTGQGDAINLSDLLELYNPVSDAITDFVQITTSGSNSSVFVDRDGLASTYGFSQIATISGVTGLTDEAALVTSGNLIVT